MPGVVFETAESQFTKILRRVSGDGSLTMDYPDTGQRAGQYIEGADGTLWKIARAERNDDWFDPRVRLTLVNGNHEIKPLWNNVKIAWLEDELMPRA